MKGILFLFVILSSSLRAESFQELKASLDEHELLQSHLSKAMALREKAGDSGSWGDPTLTVAAVNFPQGSLDQNESMMTGYQFGLSQKLSLSGKYGKMRDSSNAMSESLKAQAGQLKREFTKALWELSAHKEKLVQERIVLKENLDWIENNLKITNRLYSTGKVPQQAVLDIQIRKSELASLIEQNRYAIESVKYQIAALLDFKKPVELNLKTVPWGTLNKWKTALSDEDYREQAIKQELQASDLKLSAQNRNIIPDVTVGISYTKRNDIDGLGDFVGASISIPLPSSDKRYAQKREAVQEKLSAEKRYRHYLNTKPNTLKEIELQILDLENQLMILKKQTIKFAKSSRDVTAKSYSRGGADYLELLRAELQYQNQLMKEISLIAKVKTKKIEYLYINGSKL